MCSLDAGCAGFYACARYGVVRGGACNDEGGGCLAVTVLARRELRWLLHACARHGVPRGGACTDGGGGCLAVTVLARRELRWLLRLRSLRCGARRRM